MISPETSDDWHAALAIHGAVLHMWRNISTHMELLSVCVVSVCVCNLPCPEFERTWTRGSPGVELRGGRGRGPWSPMADLRLNESGSTSLDRSRSWNDLRSAKRLTNKTHNTDCFRQSGVSKLTKLIKIMYTN
jgi:hypothetical protein